MNAHSFPGMSWQEIWRRLLWFRFDHKGHRKYLFRVGISTCSFGGVVRALKGAIQEMSGWRFGRWLEGLRAGKKLFAKALFVFVGARASAGWVPNVTVSIEALTGFKQNIIDLKGKFPVLVKISCTALSRWSTFALREEAAKVIYDSPKSRTAYVLLFSWWWGHDGMFHQSILVNSQKSASGSSTGSLATMMRGSYPCKVLHQRNSHLE